MFKNSNMKILPTSQYIHFQHNESYSKSDQKYYEHFKENRH